MKKFFSYFNFMELNLSRRDYKSPLIRIFASILVAMAVALLRLGITLTNPIVNIIVSLLCIAIFVIAILCFFIASIECLQVGDNRKKDKAREQDKYK